MKEDDITFQIKGHTYLLVQTSTLSPYVKNSLPVSKPLCDIVLTIVYTSFSLDKRNLLEL